MAETTTEIHGEAGASHSLWNRFQRAGSREEYIGAWLSYQCTATTGVRHGLVVAADGGTYRPEAAWPEAGPETQKLVEITERTLTARSGLVTELDGDRVGAYAVAYPVFEDKVLVAAVALELRPESEAQLRAAMNQLQWGTGWLELWFRRNQSQEGVQARHRLQSTVEMLASVLSEERFDDACATFVTELAGKAECDRVSIGFVSESSSVTVQSVSHTAHFTKKMNLNRTIGLAMEEAVVQRSEIVFPQPDDPSELRVTRDHEQLANQQGVSCLLTIPLYQNEHYYAAVTFERARERPFTANEIALCRAACTLAGPMLEVRRQGERAVVRRIWDGLKDEAAKLRTPGHSARKIFAGAVVLLVLFAVFARGDYRLSADVAMEGAVLRSVVAPFDGYIDRAPARPGDVIEAEDLLCGLDARDLRLERLRLRGREAQVTRQLQEAQAQHDRAEVNVARAQLEQTRAEMALIDSRIERTELRAPFRGVVISGDLSQRLGGAVRQGEVLFEVAPLDAYRVILAVDERRIADVEPGQSGTLLLSALPDDSYDFIVDRITPIASAEEGRTFFRVEATLQETSERLRPGMEGVGKIEIDRRRLISIWTRDLVEWVRLALWRYLP